MSGNQMPTVKDGGESKRMAELIHQIRAHYASQRQLRKGLCLLNAGLFTQAVAELEQATQQSNSAEQLPHPLLTALIGAGAYGRAADQIQAAKTDETDPITRTIRLALLRWKNDQAREAINLLRNALADNSESAELHFQLGTLLAAMDQTDEAELRFTQAVAIDGEHVDALIALAMCQGAHLSPRLAVRHLSRAQQLKPHHARIALMLAMAGRAAAQSGTPMAVRANIPPPPTQPNDAQIEELSLLIEREPDFADALLALDSDEVDAGTYQLLTDTLLQASRRHPNRATIRFQCGQALERVGRVDEAIHQAERAVDMDPKCVQALILLARLYAQTDRRADAVSRLEQTIAMGAEYADAYYLLGNLYRDEGYIDRARWAYRNALRINGGYRAARRALDALAA